MPWYPGAPPPFAAETEEGILEQVARHAREDHDLPEVPEELVRQVLANLRLNMTQDAIVRACRRPGVLRMDFQPIIDTARGTVVGYESLARFSGPPHTTPDRWFAVARAAGVGAELEARALRAALDARSALPPNCFLSVNVGPDALLTAPVAAVFAGAGDLRGVVVEITEQTAVDNYDALTRAIAPLRAAGALLAVDDAGAGFASLKHITVLRPDFVKVDRDLVAGIDKDETKAAVVEALGMFTSRLDAWLIAEGVETTAELDRLLSLRVPLVQGYGLGPPRPVMGAARSDAVALCRRRTVRRHLRRPLRPRRTRPAGHRVRGRPRLVRRESRRRLGRGRRRVRPTGQPHRPVRQRTPAAAACSRASGWPTWRGASRPARRTSATSRSCCATSARGSSGS